MDNSEWLLGHKGFEARVNVRRELHRLKLDPLESLLRELEEEKHVILQNEFSRYREAYYFYYLSLDRFFHEMSVAVRWSNGPYYVRKSGRGYTKSERKLANDFNKIKHFLEFDFFNCLLHARTLLDRTIALARYFLQESNLPSFVSFNEQKKFFQRRKQPYGSHEEYADHVREKTDWFDMPLKIVRDKFLVHAGPRHMRVFGYPGRSREFGLTIILPNSPNPDKPLERVKAIVVSIPELARDMESFLKWFCDYGLRMLKNE